jgi:hypothetical protein
MGRWSSSQLRGGGGRPPNSTQVQLFNDAGTGIFWDFQGTVPAFWVVEQADTPPGEDQSMELLAVVAGTVLAFNGTTEDDWYRVAPSNALGTPVGPYSNQVRFTS